MENDVVSKIREFNRFYTPIIGVVNHHILESNFSLSEVRAMFEIHYHPGITARQIKNIMQIDEGYLSRMIARFEARKLLVKKKSKIDSRLYSLTLSKTGARVFLQLDQRSTDAVSALIKPLNENEKLELIRHMDKIQILLKKTSYES